MPEGGNDFNVLLAFFAGTYPMAADEYDEDGNEGDSAGVNTPATKKKRSRKKKTPAIIPTPVAVATPEGSEHKASEAEDEVEIVEEAVRDRFTIMMEMMQNIKEENEAIRKENKMILKGQMMKNQQAINRRLDEEFRAVSGKRVGQESRKKKGGRGHRVKQLEDFSDDEEEESSEEEDMPRRPKAGRRNRERKALNAFWFDFKSNPFPRQFLPYEKMEGENMLRAGLTNHPTMSAYVGEKNFQQKRNEKECRLLAKLMDCLLDDFGIDDVKNSKSAEVLMRRLAAVMRADMQGNWYEANAICADETDLLSNEHVKRVQKQAKLNRESANGGGPPKGEGVVKK